MTHYKATRLVVAVLLATGATYSLAVAQDETRLLRTPSISETHLTFVYAGDIWIAGRDGSNPRRLTSHPADEKGPIFSPDGQSIAFTANYENNQDVYTIPITGGQPARLTWHPGADTATDWTPDGEAVVFASARETNHGRSAQLYHVSTKGGPPERRMDARIYLGRYDAAGERFAYIPHGPAYNGLYGGSSGWRGYRGGTTPSITIMDIANNQATQIPGDRVNDINPMWVGDDLYFISDREDKVLNLYRFNSANGAVTKVSNETVWDIRSADVHGDRIVYESAGQLKEFNLTSGAVSNIHVSISPDLQAVREQWKDAGDLIGSIGLSPSGKRALITARGEVFTIPIDDGSTRNITDSDGSHEYTAIWSPAGGRIAYIADDGSRQRLVLRRQNGLGGETSYDLGTEFYGLLGWTGDGLHIIYEDNHLNLKMINVGSGRSTTISTSARREIVEIDTSSDGRWIAYTEEQENFHRDLMLFDVQTGQSTRISDGLADVATPAFSQDGKYLYFAASTNSGLGQVFLDLSSQERPYRAGLYALVLAADTPSPLLPKPGDEEIGKEPDKDGDKTGDAKVVTKVDLVGIQDRIIGLPVTERNYSNLAVGEDGALYYLQNVQAGAVNTKPGERASAENELVKFDFEDLSATSVLDGVTNFSISHDRTHIIAETSGGGLSVAKLGDTIKLEPVDKSGLRALIDPRAEWQLIFDEVWRMEKSYFYDPAMHGLDWQSVRDRYRPLVTHVGRREDLNALMVEMIGEMQVGHNRTRGGDVHREKSVNAGLLGADLLMENGRYKISHIYTGEAWNPFLAGPLAAPGVDVAEGDFILSVNGKPLTANDNIHGFLQGTAGNQVSLTVSDRADGRSPRTVTIVPTESERTLRLWDWVEGNRKAVDAATNGRVGYIYLPNTAGAGYTFFNRMFFSQVDKDALIIDERANGGGQAANYITDILSRKYLSGWRDRDALVFNTPGGAHYGPKIMLIDQDAGSGGDYLPYAFREEGIGKLMGTRTWGGLIGISINPRLVDGGNLSVPYFRFFDTSGNWSIENEGTVPDVTVSLDPAAANVGRDTQLESAIADIVDQLESFVPTVPETAPPYPTQIGQ